MMNVLRALSFAVGLAVASGPGFAQAEIDRGDGDRFAAGYEAFLGGRYEEAIAVWLPIAEGGDPRAQYNIGVLYANGLGVPRDMGAAMDWWERAARQLHVRAAHNLALAILTGEPVGADGPREPDLGAALRWLRIGADAGYPNSQYSLGKLYAEGAGVEADPKKAAELYLAAAKQGFARAQYNLGKAYRDGAGVPQDQKLSVFWFRQAAERGHALAQDKMADRALRGDGVEADEVAALTWSILAARQGVAAAEARRFDLATRLAPEAVAEAERRAAAFAPKRGPVEDPPGEAAAAP